MAIRPFAEQQAYAFAIMGSSDALGDGGTNVHRDQFRTLVGVLALGDRVCYLEMT